MIESVQNPKVRLARALQRRRERERLALLFVEGARLVEEALASGDAPHLLFYTPTARQHPTTSALVERHGDVAWAVSDAVMQHMADTVTPQGIAAIVPLLERDWPARPSLLLVIDRVRDPGNLGTLLRTAAAAGVDGVLATRGTVDPWSDKVLRAGMGVHFRLPLRSRLSWAKLLPLVEGLTLHVADVGGTVPYDAVDWSQPSVVVVGGEADGPSADALGHATSRLVIPMANEVESLNAAVAGAVILFEARRQRRHTGG